ncbi:unnamed protein product, partial [Mycena citricolor]
DSHNMPTAGSYAGKGLDSLNTSLDHAQAHGTRWDDDDRQNFLANYLVSRENRDRLLEYGINPLSLADAEAKGRARAFAGYAGETERSARRSSDNANAPTPVSREEPIPLQKMQNAVGLGINKRAKKLKERESDTFVIDDTGALDLRVTSVIPFRTGPAIGPPTPLRPQATASSQGGQDPLFLGQQATNSGDRPQPPSSSYDPRHSSTLGQPPQSSSSRRPQQQHQPPNPRQSGRTDTIYSSASLPPYSLTAPQGHVSPNVMQQGPPQTVPHTQLYPPGSTLVSIQSPCRTTGRSTTTE